MKSDLKSTASAATIAAVHAPKTTPPRKKDDKKYAIGDGNFWSVARIANDLGTTPARARKVIRDLKVPIVRLPGSRRIFVHRDKYEAALLACETDPNVPPKRRRIKRKPDDSK